MIKIIIIFISIHTILAIINKKIRCKVYDKYNDYLNAIKIFTNILNITNNYLFSEEYKEHIDMDLYQKRTKNLLKNLPKYNLAIGEITILTKILRKASKQEKIEQDEMFDLNLEVTDKLFLLKRKKEYIRSVFSPINFVNNLIDVWIYFFYDYEEYFLNPQTESLKKNLTKTISYLALFSTFIVQIVKIF